MSDNGGVKGVDAPILSEGERKLAGQAQNAFEAGSYAECLSHLSRLRESRPADNKVLHNIAVAKYYHSGLTETGDFVQSLTGLRASLEASINDGGEVEKRVLLFNLATVHFQLQHFQTATAIVERLLPRVEQFSDTFSRSVYFLLCDLYLSMSDVDKAAWLLSKIDKYLAAQNISAMPSSNGTSGKSDRNQHADRDRSANHLGDQELCRLCQFKVRLCLMKRSGKQACKREINNMMTASNGVVSVFLKSQFEYGINRKYRKSAKLLCKSQQVATNGSDALSLRKANASAMGASIDYHDDLFYNNLACVYSRLDRHHMAAFYFQQALQLNTEQLTKAATEHGSASLQTLDISHRHRQLLYNAGVELLLSDQPAEAFDCLLAASNVFYSSPLLWLRLAEACIAVHQKERDRVSCKTRLINGTVGSGPHHKVVLAPNSEQPCQPVMTAAMPALTLEFADLCLKNAMLLLGPLTPAAAAAAASAKKANSGASAQSTSASDWSSSNRASATSMKLAGDNGLDSGSGDGSSGDERTTVNPLAFDDCPPSSANQFPYQQPVDVGPLRTSVLLCGAYVALCLGNYTAALSRAEEILKQSSSAAATLPGLYRCHASMYAAEALVELGDVDAAISVLTPDHLTDMNAHQPAGSDAASASASRNSTKAGSSHTHFDQQSPLSLAAGKASLYINLASVHCLNGDVERARRCLQNACDKVQTSELPPQTIQLAVYVELLCGNLSAALQILKRHNLPAAPEQPEAMAAGVKATGGSTKHRRKN